MNTLQFICIVLQITFAVISLLNQFDHVSKKLDRIEKRLDELKDK
jgi:hypothetical protein